MTLEQLLGLVVREREIGHAQLVQPSVELQTGEGQRWIRPRHEHHRQRGRQPDDEVREGAQRRTRRDLLDFVEHEHGALGPGVEALEDPVEHHGVRAVTAVEVVERVIDAEGLRDQVAEPSGRVVAGVEGEPGAVGALAVVREPVGQQRRLARRRRRRPRASPHPRRPGNTGRSAGAGGSKRSGKRGTAVFVPIGSDASVTVHPRTEAVPERPPLTLAAAPVSCARVRPTSPHPG